MKNLIKKILTEFRQSARLAAPLMAANLIQNSSGFLAVLMVAHLGHDTLAGAALGYAIYIPLIVFFFGTFNAISVSVAQNFGAKNKKGIQITLAQGFLLALVVAIPMIIILLLVPPVLPLVDSNQHVVMLATEYLHAVVWCVLPLAYLIVMEQFLIGLSFARFILIISIVQVPFEIIVSYVLIFGKFGLPKLGIAGVGYGFSLVFTVAAICIGSFLYYNKSCKVYQPFKKILEFNKKYFWELVRVGWPIGTMAVIEVAFNSAAAFLLAKISNDQLAAHQLTRQFWIAAMMLTFALAQANTVRVGQAVGRNNPEQVKFTTYTNMGFGFMVMFIIASCYMIFARHLLSIDINMYDPKNFAVIHYAIIFLAISSLCLLIDNFRFIIIGALRGLKDTLIPMFISIITFWGLALPCSFFLAFKLHLGGVGVWLGFAFGILSGAIILLLRFKKLSKHIDTQKILLH